MDYVFEETKKDLIQSNLLVFSKLRESSIEGITKYVKSVKTKTLFNNKKWFDEPQNNSSTLDINDLPDITKSLESLTFKKEVISEIKDCLRSSKISRQLRNKIIKCYYLTNNGLTDRVLFNFYIDFIPFLKRLYYFITDNRKELNKLQEYENILINYVIAYDRAYKNRTFNSYLFEDIHEYSIDYNASLQHLLSNYNTCVHILTRSYNESKKDYYRETPRFLVNINLNNTVSNPVNINFHVHDLTAPELVFCLLHKEIINEYIKLKKIINPIDLPKEYKEEYSFLDTNDIYNDCLRVILTFNFDFELYSFWFWSFNIQNTQLYNKDGFMNEDNFAHELIRFISVKIIFDYMPDISCPIPELFIYWDRYYKKFHEELKEFYDPKVKDKQEYTIANSIHDQIIPDCKIFNPENELFDHIREQYRRWKFPIQTGINVLHKDRALASRFEWMSHCKSYCDENGLFALYKEIKTMEVSKIVEPGKEVDMNRQKHAILLDSMIYCFLKKMQTEQNSQISILRRNLVTGEPLATFIKEIEYDSFYCLDPQGGHFSINAAKREKYYEIRNQMMDIVWDISLQWKKDYIEERIKSV
ncbi:MAG: hypothetical protein IPJ51_16855 [Saprospiraceae bacterium]|nr:hypothetical protein [Saprospiraceae bacterium]